MGSGGWTSTQGTEVGSAADYGQHSQYALRPLSLGEILDRSFAVYRANFWLFVGIGSLSAVVQLIANAVQLVVFHGIVPTPQQTQIHFGFSHEMFGRQVGGGITGLLVFLVSALTQAATVWALSEVYLGRRTTIGDSIRVVIGRWLRFLGIRIWQGWSGVWLLLVLALPGFLLLLPRYRSPWIGGTLIFFAVTGGLVYGVIAFIRNSLGVQVAVLEGLKVRAAMRRSKVLAAGAKGRMFVVYLIGWCLLIVAGMLQMPLALIVGFGAMRGEQHVLAQVAMLLVTFVAHSTVVPVVMIGLSVVYFDQRVRQDGLDLLLMLGGGDPSNAISSESSTIQTAEPAGDAAGL